MNTGLLFCFLLAAATTFSHPTEDFGLHLEEEWTKFKETYGRVFANHENELLRKGIFENNLKQIRLHNLLYSRGLKSFALGINMFTDMTTEEYQYSVVGFQFPKNASEGGRMFLSPMNVELPKEVDWRTKGLVTPVKNQGHCGSCWAFSSTGSIEGQQARKTGKLVSLSEQNLVDCSGHYGNAGCDGGLMTNAFRYIIDNKGIDTEEGYPYEAIDIEGCRFKKDKIGAVVVDYTNIESGSEQQLMEAVATVGPISVAIDASHFSFKHFHGDGVFEEPNCSSEDLTHAVLVVGYGTQDGKDYWIVKNSWGTNYGSSGYIKMARNQNNMCGIATMPSYPNV